MKFVTALALLAITTASANAATPDITTLTQCFKLRGSETDEVRLKCYDKAFAEAEGATLKVSELPDPPKPAHLRNLWRADEEQAGVSTVFRQYKQNYILPIAYSEIPNQRPSSPSADHTSAFPAPLESTEMKFQLSVKSRLPITSNESRHSWWLAYTQQSHWQIYDTDHSRPFRESNYEPEAVYSYDLSQMDAPAWPMSPQFLNFGLVHQSNGQPLPRSRSWNRIYAQLGMEQPVGNGSLAVLVRPWIRIHENGNDDNPDITRYLGYGDLELKYWLNGRVYSLLARKKSIQLDFPMPFLPGVHLQYFNGYGESLIDYNHRNQTFGIGYSLPYGM